MHILWHPRASAELEEAAEYYEVRRANLGQQFIQQVEAALEFVKLFPNGWPRVSERSRRIRTRRFPYGVVYQIHADYIRVIAIMHLHRRPGYWLGREE
jgi:plasmid stabilization system protein ParE